MAQHDIALPHPERRQIARKIVDGPETGHGGDVMRAARDAKMP